MSTSGSSNSRSFNRESLVLYRIFLSWLDTWQGWSQILNVVTWTKKIQKLLCFSVVTYFASQMDVKCMKLEQIGTCELWVEIISELEFIKINWNLLHYPQVSSLKDAVLTEHASTPCHLTKLRPGPGAVEVEESLPGSVITAGLPTTWYQQGKPADEHIAWGSIAPCAFTDLLQVTQVYFPSTFLILYETSLGGPH